MPFRPEEVLFAPTLSCNLACSHCANGVPRSKKTLPQRDAARFLGQCAAIGIRRVGFTGGEPFLETGFLFSLVKETVRDGLLFGRIMTNGVWWPGARELKDTLTGLRDAGYDGEICVSLDTFHVRAGRPGYIKKVARFIKTAVSLWRRPDVVSMATVTGLRDDETASMLRSLAALLGARVMQSPAGRTCIKGPSVFIRADTIALAPIGSAAALKDPWDGRWFKEDHCNGPGNVFLVMPDGDVKPCCGYASDENALTIGNIRRHSARDLLERSRRNRFVSTVFGSGLSAIRKRLERAGVGLPGKTSSHCYFCSYVINDVPKGALARCLDR